MDVKKIKEIAQAFLDEYSKQTKTKKVTLKQSDIEERIKNPCGHDDYIDVKATHAERVGMKVFCYLVDVCKLV